jgi:hypothetical protein
MPVSLAWITGSQLLCGQANGSLRLWNLLSTDASATLTSSADGQDWLVATDPGFFDGTPKEWSRLGWRFSNNTFDVVPVEAFFNEFYRPGLLSDIIEGKAPLPARSIATRDRRQPRIAIAIANSSTSGNGAPLPRTVRTIHLRIDVAEAAMLSIRGVAARGTFVFSAMDPLSACGVATFSAKEMVESLFGLKFES